MLKAEPFPALAQMAEIRGHRVRNRFVMGPLCTMYAAPDGSATPQLIEYYRARARGGAGIVIVEITFTDNVASRSFHAQLGAQSDMMLPGLNELAEAIRAEGALAGLQIAHCGSQRVVGQGRVLAPSPIAWAPGKPIPEEMTEDDIEQVLEGFTDAAGRLAQAGFDLVELQGAHGYVINTFISPATNQRTDGWGGSHENRMRFPLELVRRVRERIGHKRLLGVRMNGHDLMPDGYDTEDYCRVAGALEEAGVDVVHVSAGTYRAMERRVTPMYFPEAPFAGYAARIKEAVSIPVIAAGSIHSTETAEGLVRDGKADFVALARPMFADPDLPRKTLEGRRGEVIPCIRCNTCVAREQGGARSLCAINPGTGSENRAVTPIDRPRRVFVVGGGPAGMQAALTAARRGHHVTLYEKKDRLGGALRVASTLEFKAPIRPYLTYMENALDRAGVGVRLGTDLDCLPAEAEPCDAMVVAVGATWTIPEEFASGGIEVVDPLTALTDTGGLGQRIVVIGAGTIGAETSWHLAKSQRQVTLVERRDTLGDDVNLISRMVIPGALADHGATVRFGCEGRGIQDHDVLLTIDGDTETLPADSVVLAFGARPAAASVAAPAKEMGLEVRHVGEYAGLFGLRWATHSGHMAAMNIGAQD